MGRSIAKWLIGVVACGALGTLLGWLTVEYRWFNVIMSVPTCTLAILVIALRIGRWMDE